jgi:hypothetical protein
VGKALSSPYWWPQFYRRKEDGQSWPWKWRGGSWPGTLQNDVVRQEFCRGWGLVCSIAPANSSVWLPAPFPPTRINLPWSGKEKALLRASLVYIQPWSSATSTVSYSHVLFPWLVCWGHQNTHLTYSCIPWADPEPGTWEGLEWTWMLDECFCQLKHQWFYLCIVHLNLLNAGYPFHDLSSIPHIYFKKIVF